MSTQISQLLFPIKRDSSQQELFEQLVDAKFKDIMKGLAHHTFEKDGNRVEYKTNLYVRLPEDETDYYDSVICPHKDEFVNNISLRLRDEGYYCRVDKSCCGCVFNVSVISPDIEQSLVRFKELLYKLLSRKTTFDDVATMLSTMDKLYEMYNSVI